MTFVSNIAELMRKKNFTYEDLQHLSQVAPDTVAKARDHRIATCKLATLEKIARALEVEISDLYEWKK